MFLSDHRFKRITAAALAVTMSVTMLGMGSELAGLNETAVISSAAETVDDLDKQLAEIEKTQKELLL